MHDMSSIDAMSCIGSYLHPSSKQTTPRHVPFLLWSIIVMWEKYMGKMRRV